ncbi:MAG: hypothetical protein ACJAYC_003298, partial [Halieaceae bacterium]
THSGAYGSKVTGYAGLANTAFLIKYDANHVGSL